MGKPILQPTVWGKKLHSTDANGVPTSKLKLGIVGGIGDAFYRKNVQR
jgi:hypothetical protein